jgi:tetratricopeptide (TPR) repeat protein
MTPETPEAVVVRRGPPVFTWATIRENRKWGTLYWNAMRQRGGPSERARGPWLGRRAWWIGAVVALAVGDGGQRDAAAAAPLWERAEESTQAEANARLSEAESILGATADDASAPTKLGRAEGLLRAALADAPDDYRAWIALADVEARLARPADALTALARACPSAPRGPIATSCWFRLGIERSRAARFPEALVAYERIIALGDPEGAAYTNAAEILMALGRLPEAAARYREAIQLDTPVTGRIESPYGLSLSTYGLAVALDRDGAPDAAREMMARALALDPRHAKLTAAEQVGGDVFFVPEGDVYYYLGLASEMGGHVDDAEAAFQEFLSRLPRSPWAPRARAHIDALLALERAASHAPPAGEAAPRLPTLRVVAAGTVLARGPVPAPLVDAAWRERPHLVDDCLSEAVGAGRLAPRDGFRFAVELELDATGAVADATVEAAAPLDAVFSRCVQAAVRAGLRVPRPRRARPTRVRVEILVGLSNGEAGGV